MGQFVYCNSKVLFKNQNNVYRFISTTMHCYSQSGLSDHCRRGRRRELSAQGDTNKCRNDVTYVQ